MWFHLLLRCLLFLVPVLASNLPLSYFFYPNPTQAQTVRTESGISTNKPVLIIWDVSEAGSLENWKTRRYLSGPWDNQELPFQSCRSGSAGLHLTEGLGGEAHGPTAIGHTSAPPQASLGLSAGLSRAQAALPSAKFRSGLKSLLFHLFWF